MTIKKDKDTPTAAQFVAAALAQLIRPLAQRLTFLNIEGAELTLTGDFTAQAWLIESNFPPFDQSSNRFDDKKRPVSMRVQPVRLNRLNIVGQDGKPTVEECEFHGKLGNISVPFAELATRNATISLYELDWLLSQHVAGWEAYAVNHAVALTEQAGD